MVGSLKATEWLARALKLCAKLMHIEVHRPCGPFFSKSESEEQPDSIHVPFEAVRGVRELYYVDKEIIYLEMTYQEMTNWGSCHWG